MATSRKYTCSLNVYVQIVSSETKYHYVNLMAVISVEGLRPFCCCCNYSIQVKYSNHILIVFCMACIVLHLELWEVVKYRAFLTASYECVQSTEEDQWPPVQFQKYINLATVVKVEDFMEEDECTKAMMNGNLEIIKRMKQPIEMEQVSQMYRIISIHCEINFMSADWQVRGWYIG